MAVTNATRVGLKRKQASDAESDDGDEINSAGPDFDLPADEDNSDSSSDDGQADNFPEILESDSSDGLSQDEDESAETEENDEIDSDTSDSELHIFPKPKLVLSEATGQPKFLYPDIEPDYDSDSSTEDVSWSNLKTNRI